MKDYLILDRWMWVSKCSDGHLFRIIAAFVSSYNLLFCAPQTDRHPLNGKGISWTICKAFLPGSKQITMPASHCLNFYRPDALFAQPTVSKHWRQMLQTIEYTSMNEIYEPSPTAEHTFVSTFSAVSTKESFHFSEVWTFTNINSMALSLTGSSA